MQNAHLSLKQRILVAGTLFGMFFGAGNLIFPVHLGQLAGRNLFPATIGFIITAVGIPILTVCSRWQARWEKNTVISLPVFFILL